ALLPTTSRRHLRARSESRDALPAIDGLAEAMRVLVAGLRAGAHPASAAESAAEDAHPQTKATMRAVAAAARLDGDLTTVVDTRSPTLAPALDRLAQARPPPQPHRPPPALPRPDALAAVAAALEHGARLARQVLARMAGPRSSALALSLLPALGLALGAATGANPLAILTSTALGQALLVIGVTLLCAGLT